MAFHALYSYLKPYGLFQIKRKKIITIRRNLPKLALSIDTRSTETIEPIHLAILTQKSTYRYHFEEGEMNYKGMVWTLPNGIPSTLQLMQKMKSKGRNRNVGMHENTRVNEPC